MSASASAPRQTLRGSVTLELELQRTHEEIERERAESRRLRDALRRAEEEAREARTAALAREASLAALQKNQRRAEERQSGCDREIEELQTLCERFQARLRESERARHAASESRASLEAQIEAQSQQVRDLSQSLARASGKLESAQAEAAANRARVNALESQATARSDVADRRAQEIEMQEARLRNYARSLNHARQELARACEKFASEIHSAKTLHPLKDYLALTQFEAAKLELKLKTTPTSSPDRAALESALARFLEQRDFLNSLLEASRRELDAQAREVQGLVEWAAVSGVVPPPPPASALARSRNPAP